MWSWCGARVELGRRSGVSRGEPRRARFATRCAAPGSGFLNSSQPRSWRSNELASNRLVAQLQESSASVESRNRSYPVRTCCAPRSSGRRCGVRRGRAEASVRRAMCASVKRTGVAVKWSVTGPAPRSSSRGPARIRNRTPAQRGAVAMPAAVREADLVHEHRHHGTEHGRTWRRQNESRAALRRHSVGLLLRAFSLTRAPPDTARPSWGFCGVTPASERVRAASSEVRGHFFQWRSSHTFAHLTLDT